MGELSMNTRVPLGNGTAIPVLGLGVWKMAEGEETEHAVNMALEAGYRHIDTAKLYGNERSVGKAVRESGIPRGDIFVTTKLWPTDFLAPERGFRNSLERLDIGYVDLYLIHWPVPFMSRKIWKTLERVYEEGLARAIGVSNFSIGDIEKLHGYARILPMANQVEFNPASHDLKLVEYCKEKNIVVEAYSPLSRGKLTSSPTVAAIAKQYGKTPAQVLIRWALQHGTIPLPKSSNKERIIENTNIFDFSLDPADMDRLNTLSR